MKKIIISTLLLGSTFSVLAQQNAEFFKNLFQQKDDGKPLFKQTETTDWLYYQNNNDQYTCVDMGINDMMETQYRLCVGVVNIKSKDGSETSVKKFFDSFFSGWDNNSSVVMGGGILEGNNIRMIAYMKDTVKFKRNIASFLAKKGMKADIRFKEDENWSFYTDCLLPSQKTMQKIRNKQFVSELKEKGDDGSKVREIRHTIRFSNAKDCNSMLTDATAKGYKKLSQSGKDGDFVIVISKAGKSDINSITQCTCQLIDLANKHKGTYESWECNVTK